MRLHPITIGLRALRGERSIQGRPLPGAPEAIALLRRCTGQDFGEDAEAWGAWLRANRWVYRASPDDPRIAHRESATDGATSRADDPVLRLARRLSGALARALISPDEFVDRLFMEFAGDRRAATELAAPLLDSIPEAAREAFIGRVREALAAGFRRQPFLYGGAERVPEERLRREAEEQTARVRAWASELRRLLDGGWSLDSHCDAADPPAASR
jgi:hypothetical protein